MCWPQPAEQHGTGQSTGQGVPTPQISFGQDNLQGPPARSLWSTEVPMLCVLRPHPSPRARALDAGLAPTQDTQNAVGGHWEARGILPAAHMDTSSRGQACPTLGTHTSSLCQGPVLCHHPPSHTWAGSLQSGHSSLSAHCWKRTFVNLHHED